MRDEERIKNTEVHWFVAGIFLFLCFVLSWFAYNLAFVYPQVCDWSVGRTVYTIQCQLNKLMELR